MKMTTKWTQSGLKQMNKDLTVMQQATES